MRTEENASFFPTRWMTSRETSAYQGMPQFVFRGDVSESMIYHALVHCNRSGDTVSFQIATNQRTGNLTARFIRLENPTHPIFYRGIFCSAYMDIGTIERADVAKQITFNFSETRVNDELVVGDNVEFNIQTRNVRSALIDWSSAV